MFAILITGHDKLVVPPVGDGTKARILKMLANVPRVANPPKVRMSFRKFLLLPSVSETSLCLFSVEPIMFTQNGLLGFAYFAISNMEAASPSSTSTNVTTAAVVRLKFAESRRRRCLRRISNCRVSPSAVMDGGK